MSYSPLNTIIKIKKRAGPGEKKITFRKKICVQGNKWQRVVIAFVGSEV